MSAPVSVPRQGWLWLVLILMGAGWGLSQPLSKIAVSTGHQHFGLIFWQLTISALVLLALLRVRGLRLRWDGAACRIYILIALIGTILPQSASYSALVHLPSGIASLALTIIPMIAFPIALALGTDRFSWRRFGGLCLGFLGVLLIVLPEASLPEPHMAAWVLVAMIAPAFYAFEGNFVARWGTAGLGPMEVIAGASLLGAGISLVLAVGTGQFIDPLAGFGAPEWAFLGATALHIVVYTTYVWMAGRAGATFTAQVSYLVTGFAVLWAMLLLGERYPLIIWAAMAVMLAGMALVQPRGQKTLGNGRAPGDTPVRDG
ncbi:DMT family transporter [Primorskyibacter sp. S187A]|uniref:DMT family transporter n=1 Tax=Primorskyibacter sp. S187A TaxID=3415130 RepID=UPI003C7D8E58